MELFEINENNMTDNDVKVIQNKARALLVRDNSFLICNYAGVYMLPGGSVDNGESYDVAILRELREEIGIEYKIQELERLILIKYYQKNYPNRDGGTKDRIMQTLYYFGPYRGIDLSKSHRTEKEKKDKFEFSLVSFDDLNHILDTDTGNPRKPYFDRELSKAVNEYKLMMK